MWAIDYGCSKSSKQISYTYSQRNSEPLSDWGIIGLMEADNNCTIASPTTALLLLGKQQIWDKPNKSVSTTIFRNLVHQTMDFWILVLFLLQTFCTSKLFMYTIDDIKYLLLVHVWTFHYPCPQPFGKGKLTPDCWRYGSASSSNTCS